MGRELDIVPLIASTLFLVKAQNIYRNTTKKHETMKMIELSFHRFVHAGCAPIYLIRV